MRIGVLALQGGFKEHLLKFSEINVNAAEVRNRQDLHNCDALVVPGGESTAIIGLLFPEVFDWIKQGMPYMGTCAGAIILASVKPEMFEVERNAYGSQMSSFISDVSFDNKIFEGVFIRAPKLRPRNASVIANVGDDVVGVRDNKQIAFSFHPELTTSPIIHNFFIDVVLEKI